MESADLGGFVIFLRNGVGLHLYVGSANLAPKSPSSFSFLLLLLLRFGFALLFAFALLLLLCST
jgi:hypothetical protein